MSIILHLKFQKKKPEIVERVVVKTQHPKKSEKSEQTKKSETSEIKQRTSRVVLNSAIRDESKYENNNYTLNLNEILQNVSKIDMIYATLTNSMKLFDDYTNILEYEYEGPSIVGKQSFYIKLKNSDPKNIDEVVEAFNEASSTPLVSTSQFFTDINTLGSGFYTNTAWTGGSEPRISASVSSISTSIIMSLGMGITGTNTFKGGYTADSFNYSANEVFGIVNGFEVSNTSGGTTCNVLIDPPYRQNIYLQINLNENEKLYNVDILNNNYSDTGSINKGPSAFAVIPVNSGSVTPEHYGNRSTHEYSYIPTTNINNLKSINIQWNFLSGNTLRPYKFNCPNNTVVLDIDHSYGVNKNFKTSKLI